MSIRRARFLIVMAACLTCLGACSSAPKPSDLWSSKDSDSDTASAPKTDNGVTGIFSGLFSKKDTDKQASADDKDFPVTTGTVNTQPAESGPSGEPVAPLAKPGLVGDDPNDDVQLAKKYFRSNNFGLAERSFRHAVEKHPNDAEAWLGLAASYDRLRRFDLADRAYGEAIRLVGPTPEILNNQGFSYMLRGDYARAKKKLDDAQLKDPANPYIRANQQLLRDSYAGGKSIQ